MSLLTITFWLVFGICFLVYVKFNKRNKSKLNYSFLIGSGFSVPIGLPAVKDINVKFTSLKPSDIYIGQDMTVGFLNGQADPNGWMKKSEKQFFVEFIDDYCQLIGGGNKFQYEEFYDYYYSFYRGESNSRIEIFCDSFRKKYNKQKTVNFDDRNLIREFNNMFTQLLSSQLHKKEFRDDSHNDDYIPYDEFKNYLDSISQKDEIVNVHTLNHDLFFEHFCSTTNLNHKFCDGYSELGSPYYGELTVFNKITKVYKVRLKYFTNIFSKPIRLFKLHGSIDVYSFNLGYPNHDTTRIKKEYGVSGFYKEELNPETNKLEYTSGFEEKYPDFLSGTTEKLRSYGNEYYDIIFNHFKENLAVADILIIIGYGFWDKGINQILLDNYISKGKIPIVIDPYITKSPFFKSHKFKHIEKSISDLTYSDFASL